MKITPTLLEKIENRARETFPGEVCGLLVGKKGSEIISDAIPSPNLAGADQKFLIDPEFHLKIQRSWREKGFSIIGVYHSHPGGESGPSPADHKGLAQPGFFWLITGVKQGGRTKTALFREKMSQNPATLRNFDKVSLQKVKNSV